MMMMYLFYKYMGKKTVRTLSKHILVKDKAKFTG